MAVDDLIRITVNQSLQSSIVQNVLYYKVLIEDSTGDDVNACGEAFILDVVNALWQAVPTVQLAFDCLSVQKVFPLPIGAVRERPMSFLGTNGGTSLPAMSAGLIQKFNPAVGGVGKKGRVYIAGIPEEQTAQGRIESALFNVMDTLSNALEANLEVTPTGGEYQPAWAIRSPTTPFAITGSVVDIQFTVLPRVATQRRRRTPIRSLAP